MGQLLPGDFAGLVMCRPGSLPLGTHVAKRCRIGFLEVNRVDSSGSSDSSNSSDSTESKIDVS